MRLFGTVFLVLVAFAANSVLTRAGLANGASGAGAFMAIRTASGAAILLALLALGPGLSGWRPLRDWHSGVALVVYMAGFSFAYVQLDAGTGALILFGGVQIAMFAGALLLGERPGWPRWTGSGLGLAGLAVLFLPGATAPALWPAVLMIAAAIGWGAFSLIGRSGGPALERTTAAFVLASVPCAVLWMLVPGEVELHRTGVLLAVLSGTLASGAGYALWYSVLPRLEASVAALAQLTVPLIAMAGGVLFLGEVATGRFWLASLLILGGVALGILWTPKR